MEVGAGGRLGSCSTLGTGGKGSLPVVRLLGSSAKVLTGGGCCGLISATFSVDLAWLSLPRSPGPGRPTGKLVVLPRMSC